MSNQLDDAALRYVTRDRTSSDGRFCYGANCMWCGPISEASSTDKHPAHEAFRASQAAPDGDILNLDNMHALPCCPYCGGMLFEMPSAAEWWDGVDEFARTHPQYGDMWRWSRKQSRCFATIQQMRDAYEQFNGFRVDLERQP